jgi:hypothetical protein
MPKWLTKLVSIGWKYRKEIFAIGKSVKNSKGKK